MLQMYTALFHNSGLERKASLTVCWCSGVQIAPVVDRCAFQVQGIHWQYQLFPQRLFLCTHLFQTRWREAGSNDTVAELSKDAPCLTPPSIFAQHKGKPLSETQRRGEVWGHVLARTLEHTLHVQTSQGGIKWRCQKCDYLCISCINWDRCHDSNCPLTRYIFHSLET